MLSRFGKLGRGAVIKLLLFVLIGGTPAALKSEARAVTGYWVNASPYVNVRSGPGDGYPVIDRVYYGTWIDIACQDYGTVVNGSPIWDRLNWGGWITDYWVVNTPYARFDDRIPRCSSPPAPTREQSGVAWAIAQKGQSYQPDGKLWRGWCDRFVANAFGRANSGYDTAELHWQDLARRGLTRGGEPPYGALAFYVYKSWGHVTISLGNGRVITTPLFSDPYPGVVREAGLYETAGYRGWAWANPEWPGR